MTTPEVSIGLDERVNDVYPFGVPRVLQPHQMENRLQEYVRQLPKSERTEVTGDESSWEDGSPDPTVRALARRVITLLAALRSDDPPASALHALLLRDWQDLGSIAAVIDSDLTTAEDELGLLIDSELVEDRVLDGFREFRIAWHLALAP